MARSRDRVKFTIPARHGASSKMATLLHDVFNIEEHYIKACSCEWKDVTIICRPSQFARFMILRNKRGMKNGFRELNATLFEARDTKQKTQTTFNVWGNFNEVKTDECV